MEYRPSIDGLRAIAVIAVVVFHLNSNWLPGGFVGVDIFFVISGYLISSIIFKDVASDSFSLAGFYQRRIARIAPAFFLVGFATLSTAYFVYTPQDLASAGVGLAAAAGSVANLKYMLQGNYFEISADAQPFLHYWSLSIEEQFYLFFPFLVLWVNKYFRDRLLPVLFVLFCASFICSVALTSHRPTWAFYLPFTRAWELLAGCLLALVAVRFKSRASGLDNRWISGLFLFFVLVGLLVVNDSNPFPGYWALLPVLATAGVLWPWSSDSVGERLLSMPPLVAIGRVSYSLYLWHWPVFSFVDYHLYQGSQGTRIVVKAVLSLSLTVFSFYVIERPCRTFLNRRNNIKFAYAAMLVTSSLAVLIGLGVRKQNFINAKPDDVARGGLVFDAPSAKASVVLMGDSNGSMYGHLVKSICAEANYDLTVMSVASGDPLPVSSGTDGQLWRDSLAVVSRVKPTYLILACNWNSKIGADKSRLEKAIHALKPFVHKIVVLTQPPELPDNANRSSIRDGAFPPFHESISMAEARMTINRYLNSLNYDNLNILDVGYHFERANHEVLFLDSSGRQLYHDKNHLSGFGAELVRSDLKAALQE
jgi:peptidoglycan/LPS O-acetylase OafA/YrhL